MTREQAIEQMIKEGVVCQYCCDCISCDRQSREYGNGDCSVVEEDIDISAYCEANGYIVE